MGKQKFISEAQLAGLTALVSAERMDREAMNASRALDGLAPAYDESIEWPGLDALRNALVECGVLEE